jgi:hypothetical protein
VILDRQVIRERKVSRDCKEFRALKDLPVSRDLQVFKVHRESKEFKDFRVLKATGEMMVQSDPRDLQAVPLEMLDLLDHQVLRTVLLDLQDRPDPLRVSQLQGIY